MLFFSDKPEKNGPRVEAKLRKELGSPSPLAYDVQVEGSFRPASAGQFVGDLASDLSLKLLGASGTRPLYTFRFAAMGPPPFEIQVPVIKAGNLIALGCLAYAVRIAKPVAGEAALGDPKVFGASKFEGEPATSARLNADRAVGKLANKFVREKYNVGETEITCARHLRVAPDGAGGALLSAGTMPRSAWFGLASSFDAKAFVALARAVEAAL